MIRELVGSWTYNITPEGATGTRAWLLTWKDWQAGGGYDVNGNYFEIPKIGSKHPYINNPQLYLTQIRVNPDEVGKYEDTNDTIGTDHTGYNSGQNLLVLSNSQDIENLKIIVEFEYSTNAKRACIMPDYAISWSIKMQVEQNTMDFTDGKFYNRTLNQWEDWLEKYCDVNNLETTNADGTKITPPTLEYRFPSAILRVTTYSSCYRYSQIASCLGKINSDNFMAYLFSKYESAINTNQYLISGDNSSFTSTDFSGINDDSMWLFENYEAEEFSPTMIRYDMTFKYCIAHLSNDNWNKSYNTPHNMYTETSFSSIFAGMDRIP